MVATFLETLGPWAWVAFGLLLLGIEITMPSTILLWPGLSAIVVGAITLILGNENAIWPWQAQLFIFLILTLVIAFIGKRIVKSRNLEESDKPALNERGQQLIGKTAVLQDAISNGSGRIKIGDTTWRVTGEDAKVGSKVRVIGYDGGTLQVENV